VRPGIQGNAFHRGTRISNERCADRVASNFLDVEKAVAFDSPRPHVLRAHWDVSGAPSGLGAGTLTTERVGERPLTLASEMVEEVATVWGEAARWSCQRCPLRENSKGQRSPAISKVRNDPSESGKKLAASQPILSRFVPGNRQEQLFLAPRWLPMKVGRAYSFALVRRGGGRQLLENARRHTSLARREFGV